MGGYFGPPPNFQGNGAHFYHSVKENKAPFHFFFSASQAVKSDDDEKPTVRITI